MSHVSPPGSDEAFDTDEVAEIRQAAEDRRNAGDVALADVLEHYAAYGLPDVAECTPWEEVRDAHYLDLGVDMAGPRVA